MALIVAKVTSKWCQLYQAQDLDSDRPDTDQAQPLRFTCDDTLFFLETRCDVFWNHKYVFWEHWHTHLQTGWLKTELKTNQNLKWTPSSPPSECAQRLGNPSAYSASTVNDPATYLLPSITNCLPHWMYTCRIRRLLSCSDLDWRVKPVLSSLFNPNGMLLFKMTYCLRL